MAQALPLSSVACHSTETEDYEGDDMITNTLMTPPSRKMKLTDKIILEDNVAYIFITIH
jgi:hypothetical protein